VIRSMRDARRVNIFCSFFLLFCLSFSLLFSRKRQFSSFRSIRWCFQTKIKTNASSSFFAQTTTHSDECAKSRVVLSSSSRSYYLRACVRERAKESVHLNKTFLKWKMYGKGIALRESKQPRPKNRKIRRLRKRVRERRTMISGARESERERVARFEFLLCLWSFFLPSTRALKGKETVCAPKRGLFLSVSDFFLGKHTSRERYIFSRGVLLVLSFLRTVYAEM